MPFIRAIGRWTLAALVINCIIGGGIFGVPGELSRLLGRASPLAMVFAAIGMAVILACMTEVACRFAEPGGPYLYVRTAFGQFLGTQVGWFHLLANVGAMAALAVLFLDYLPAVLPVALKRWERGAVLAILLAIPAAVNHIGVRRGAVLNNLTTVAKLLPLTLLIVAGLAYVVKQPQTIDASEVLSPGISSWMKAMVLLLFTYGGWESALIPSGEIAEPRRTIPFGLSVGLVGCAFIYALLQFITVPVVGATITDRPLAATASVLQKCIATRFS